MARCWYTVRSILERNYTAVFLSNVRWFIHLINETLNESRDSWQLVSAYLGLNTPLLQKMACSSQEFSKMALQLWLKTNSGLRIRSGKLYLVNETAQRATIAVKPSHLNSFADQTPFYQDPNSLKKLVVKVCGLHLCPKIRSFKKKSKYICCCILILEGAGGMVMTFLSFSHFWGG